MPSLSLPSINEAEGAFWIRNRKNGLYLGFSKSVYSDGLVPLVGQEKHPDRQGLTDHSQMWFVEMLPNRSNACCLIRNAISELVLGGKDNKLEDSVSVIGCPVSGSDTQHWKIELIDDSGRSPCYRIINVYSSKVLNQAARIDQNVTLSTWNYEEQQQWFLEPVVLPTVYRFMHAWTGWYLQYKATKGLTLAKLQTSPSATESQLWILEPQEDSDACVIRSVEDSTQVLDIFSSFTTDGTPVIAFPYHGGPNQQWHIRKVDPSSPVDDRVKIVSALADTVIQVIGGPHFGKPQLQSNKVDVSQSWRILQYGSALCPQNRKAITHISIVPDMLSNTMIQALDSQSYHQKPTVNTAEIICENASQAGPGTKHPQNAEALLESGTTAGMRSRLTQVFGNFFLPSDASNQTTDNLTLEIFMKNTGKEHYELTIYDSNGHKVQEKVIRGGFIYKLPVKFRINEPYNFHVQSGRELKSFSRTFTSDNVELDVHTLFHLS